MTTIQIRGLARRFRSGDAELDLRAPERTLS
jgi:hypothetical protein